MKKSTFDLIKKQNGEAFAQAIRKYDNGIFDVPNIVNIVKYAGKDANPILRYLSSLKNIEIKEVQNTNSPFELLKQAGYTAEYADTFEKQNSISKYFSLDERLCTFYDDERYKDYYIVNAVKINVDKINREDFSNPRREDTYGTSVISIQMLKTGGSISIKNRYNDTVDCCDNTFFSNPDNIIDGLSSSLRNYFNIDFSSQKVSVPDGYVIMNDNILKYNYEIDNMYFGSDFCAKYGEIHSIDTNTQIMLDYFIFDISKKELITPVYKKDAFIDAFKQEIKDKKIQIKKDDKKNKCIFIDNVCAVKIQDGNIIYLNQPNVINIGDNFLYYNKKLRSIKQDKVEKIGNNFLYHNTVLKSINQKNVISIGNNFIYCNTELNKINQPKVKNIGNKFLGFNESLENLNYPELETIGDDFLSKNKILETLYSKELEKVGNDFLVSNTALKDLFLLKLKSVGHNFLAANNVLNTIYAPELLTVEKGFLKTNNSLTDVSLLKLKSNGSDFFRDNKSIDNFYFPQLITNKDGYVCPERLKNKIRQKTIQNSQFQR